MFERGDPRHKEILGLAEMAVRGQLPDGQRTRWRDLVKELLGAEERRHYLRAAVELEVDILSPDELASLATSSVGAGGLAIVLDEDVPVGTDLDLSITVPQRKVPLLAKATVVYRRPPEIGVAFIDLIQSDRELLEGIAVKALLSASPSGASGAES